jgi:hypothetical protein
VAAFLLSPGCTARLPSVPDVGSGPATCTHARVISSHAKICISVIRHDPERVRHSTPGLQFTLATCVFVVWFLWDRGALLQAVFVIPEMLTLLLPVGAAAYAGAVLSNHGR